MKNRFRISLLQTKTHEKKEDTFRHVQEMAKIAMKDKPDFLVLPEMFATPYKTDLFPEYAEKEHGETEEFLKSLAAKYSVYVIGGSIPLLKEGKIYNTCHIISREGEIIASHSKIHLFDIDVEGGIRFFESETLTAGDTPTVFDTEFGKMGVLICFDIRFPEISSIYRDLGAGMIFVPGAFNMTTGPAHWELLFRARANDNQIYYAGCAPARDENGVYTSYANSMVTDPWGRIMGRLDEKEGILTEDIDLSVIERLEKQMPVNINKRLDLYRKAELKK